MSPIIGGSPQPWRCWSGLAAGPCSPSTALTPPSSASISRTISSRTRKPSTRDVGSAGRHDELLPSHAGRLPGRLPNRRIPAGEARGRAGATSASPGHCPACAASRVSWSSPSTSRNQGRLNRQTPRTPRWRKRRETREKRSMGHLGVGHMATYLNSARTFLILGALRRSWRFNPVPVFVSFVVQIVFSRPRSVRSVPLCALCGSNPSSSYSSNRLRAPANQRRAPDDRLERRRAEAPGAERADHEDLQGGEVEREEETEARQRDERRGERQRAEPVALKADQRQRGRSRRSRPARRAPPGPRCPAAGYSSGSPAPSRSRRRSGRQAPPVDCSVRAPDRRSRRGRGAPAGRSTSGYRGYAPPSPLTAPSPSAPRRSPRVARRHRPTCHRPDRSASR